MNKKLLVGAVATALTTGVLGAAGIGTAVADAPVSGAVFTTNSGCTGVDLNIYSSRTSVYLDGGPTHPGAAGLPDGYYYVQVTEPDGTLLGTSVGSGNDTPVHVTNGDFDSCYQLWAILIKASDGTGGYDPTSNPGGEYKVWVSNVSTFDNNSTKTDNFKVKGEECLVGIDPDCTPQEPPSAELHVLKYYDANASGTYDSGEAYINGWKVNIHDGMDVDRFTPVDIIVDPDTYYVSEYLPIQTNWFNTDPGTDPNTQTVVLANGDEKTVLFGNVCVGAGGGLTLGFWSNKNGQKLFGSGDLALMVSLNLRNANGSAFDPASYAAFKAWLLSATATNMAYMLSAQLSAMELNVLNGFVSGSSLIYAPGTTSANSLGFATVNDIMNEANTSLGSFGLTLSGSAERAHQEALKNALDAANNNLNFVQSSPCAFSFTS